MRLFSRSAAQRVGTRAPRRQAYALDGAGHLYPPAALRAIWMDSAKRAFVFTNGVLDLTRRRREIRQQASGGDA